MSFEPIVKKTITYVALCLLACVWVNYIISGPLQIRTITLEDLQSQQTLLIDLPYDANPKNPGTYHFTFDVDGWAPLTLVTSNCIEIVKIDNQLILKDEGQNPCQKEIKRYFRLPLLHILSNTLDVTLKNAGPHSNLTVIRSGWLPGNYSLYIIIAAFYLLSLSMVPSVPAFLHLQYIWLCAGLFAYSLWPPTATLHEWSEWLHFIAYGPAILMVAIAGFMWPLTRPAYLQLDHLLARIRRIPPARMAGLLTLVFFILTASLSQILFRGLPHVHDTVIQYVHAKIMTHGRLYEPSHPLPEFFDFYDAINNGKYYGGTFPGNPLLLAAAMFLGVPWLLNPLLGALTVYAVFLLATEIGGTATGLIAAFLTLASPAIVFMSSEYMNHTACLLFMTLFLYAYIRLCKSSEAGQVRKYAIFAGASVGCAFIIRVQSAVPLALPIAVHALWLCIRDVRKNGVRTLWLAYSFSPFVAYLLYYNYATTGSPWLTGYDIFEEKFGPHYARMLPEFLHIERWYRLPADLARAMPQLQKIHTELFGWPTSSLWFVFLLFVFRACPRYGLFLLWCFLGNVLALLFIFRDDGTVWYVNRYVYESSTCLIVLTALGIERLPAIIRARLKWRFPNAAIRSITAVMLTALILLAFPFHIIDLYRWYGTNYGEMNEGYYDMLTHSIPGPALVFMKKDINTLYIANPPYDSNPVIFVPDRGEQNQKLMDYYPGRSVYMVDGWNIEKVK